MLLIYTEGNRKPQVFRDVDTAKRYVEEANCVTADEGPRWYEHGNRWILTVRWRSELAVLWKVEE